MKDYHRIINTNHLGGLLSWSMSVNKVMFGYSRQKILLCDSSKFSHTYFYSIGYVSEIDKIRSETALPENIAAMLPKK